MPWLLETSLQKLLRSTVCISPSKRFFIHTVKCFVFTVTITSWDFWCPCLSICFLFVYHKIHTLCCKAQRVFTNAVSCIPHYSIAQKEFHHPKISVFNHPFQKMAELICWLFHSFALSKIYKLRYTVWGLFVLASFMICVILKKLQNFNVIYDKNNCILSLLWYTNLQIWIGQYVLKKLSQ